MSEIAWIVGSLKERDAALELLSFEGEAQPRDELGVGVLRDALADAFFPGVTTLQTRAKYFLFVPRMYRDIEKRHRRSASGTQIMELERDLLGRLKRSGDSEGAIGSRRWVVPQTPSSAIYWTGLHTWRIRHFSDPRPRYHRWLDSGRPHAHLGLSEEDTVERLLWHEFIDAHDVLADPVMTLTSEEADFLRTRILAIKDKGARSLLKDLAAEARPPQATYLWDVRSVANRSVALGAEAHHAELLSSALHGAMLIYNHRCAQLRGSKIWGEAWAERNEAWWASQPRSIWVSWDVEGFWQRVSALPGGPAAVNATRSFVDSWVSELRRASSVFPYRRESARRAIEWRERHVKRSRARLAGGPRVADLGWDGRCGG